MYHCRAFRPYIHHNIKMEEYMQSYNINKQVEKLVDIVNNKNIKSLNQLLILMKHHKNLMK
ncbi:hypothetical protein F358_074 [Campylobacter phage F358]|uniref:Uncharacterized protein n=11 Tax=Fletchervirus CPX TaxID=1110702 RepID=A0A7T3KF37_9CAUD|nr:hypothetical protein F348_078 [Campylobacter phage F348]QPX63381.1 hypothetical protein F352_077 [Campylobacter phage F352]QPX63882.1 hypothetical protein F357_075 [Campylobacter phage F357]QPX64045.1 hypothetical protein F358_074 [Campylobacter phage F358]QPX64208.1 hypothetical protein F360_075 [Campylobacter phage F360]QPX64374.1 hypothetical protein F361_077 [Campylobacter phage F361]QPX64538.1 hypothetical protein F365_075 [Campylobacter phage F365]QPX64702.1 hypothetical protein F36